MVYGLYKLPLGSDALVAELTQEEKLRPPGGDRRELSVCSIHPQSDAHRTKVWKYRSTPPFRE